MIYTEITVDARFSYLASLAGVSASEEVYRALGLDDLDEDCCSILAEDDSDIGVQAGDVVRWAGNGPWFTVYRPNDDQE